MTKAPVLMSNSWQFRAGCLVKMLPDPIGRGEEMPGFQDL